MRLKLFKKIRNFSLNPTTKVPYKKNVYTEKMSNFLYCIVLCIYESIITNDTKNAILHNSVLVCLFEYGFLSIMAGIVANEWYKYITNSANSAGKNAKK